MTLEALVSLLEFDVRLLFRCRVFRLRDDETGEFSFSSSPGEVFGAFDDERSGGRGEEEERAIS